MSAAKPPRKNKPTHQARRERPDGQEQPEQHGQQPDFAILGGPTEDGEGAHLLRFREGTISTGEIRPVREGEPVTHREVVRLHPLDEDRRVCRVETLHEPHGAAAPAGETRETGEPRRSRPARVSNDRYRKNWDAIFDNKRKRDFSVN